jgi:hypothetical protein
MSNNIITEKLGDYVTNSYLFYGKEVNTDRHIPFIYDGMKPIYKRYIITALSFPSDKMIKTAIMQGQCMKYHPHGTGNGEIGALVRLGVFDGQGNHGYSSMTASYPPSASRYTECRLNSKWRQLIEPVLKYVPTELDELNNIVPKYIPLVFPFCLMQGSEGVGVGLTVSYPSFTSESMLEAYLKDDPTKLKSNTNLKVVTEDKVNFWKNPIGKIRMAFSYNKINNGFEIIGNPDYVKPRLSKLRKLEEDGKIYIIDESSGTDKKLLIGINKRVSIDMSKLEELVIEACIVTKSYNMFTISTNNKYIEQINGHDWIEFTYKNYEQLLMKYKSDKLSNLSDELEAYNNFSNIADYIINQTLSYEEIANKLRLSSVRPVEIIASKQVGTLRSIDSNKRIKLIQDKIKDANSISIFNVIKEFIK